MRHKNMSNEIDKTMEKFGFTNKDVFTITSYFKFKKLYSSDFDKSIKKGSSDDDLITQEFSNLFVNTLREYFDEVVQDDDLESKIIDKMKHNCDFVDLIDLHEFSQLGKVMLRSDYK